MNYFITAIGTDCGKTLVSAILCEALGADYWKPVQAGLPRDADTVKSLISNSETIIHPEKYLLQTPASPHAAAKIDRVTISLDEISLPDTKNNLVIEGAGGCLVPLNNSDFVIDIASRFHCEIILVSNIYLGSINHTLLTASYLKQKNILVKGIIFNGPKNEESESIILHHTNYRLLLRIHPESVVSKEVIKKYATSLRANLK